MYFKTIITTFFLAFFAFSIQTAAQDTAPRREVGLQFSGINFNGNTSFGAFFKKEKKENIYRRIRFFYGNANLETAFGTYALSFSSGIAIGREKRKMLDSKLECYQGPEVATSLGFATSEFENSSISVSGRFGWVVGLQHSFNKLWAINIEAVPGLQMSVNKLENLDPRFDVSVGISNTVSLGLVRKF